MAEFEERRNRQQIIKRMLQLHLIADKSEILPAKKPSKGKRKQNEEEAGMELELEEGVEGEPRFARQPKAALARGKNNAKSKPKPRRVRTPLDVGTVRALIAQVSASETLQEAIEWLRESLHDASEDSEEPGEDDDGVPLLPLLEVQKDAMEQQDFQKLLLALGMQPPIVGMESYWRIPIYLNAADLQLRAKILAGEEVQQDESEPEENEEEEEEAAQNSEEDDEEEEEEDYLDKHSRQRRQAADGNITAAQQRKLDSLMYSKSDDEAEQRAPLTKAKDKGKGKGKDKDKDKKKKNEREKGRRQRKQQQKESSSDEEEVNEIARKLARKKRKPDVSSSEEQSQSESESGQEQRQKQTAVKPNTDDLFEQLKAKRATKIKLNDMVAPEAAQEKDKDKQDDEEEDEDDAFNFNSEGYRARLLELEEEEEEQQQQEDVDDEQEAGKENATLHANNTIKSSSRTRRANVIDSDSDNEKDAAPTAPTGAMPPAKANKRPRSDNEQDAQHVEGPQKGSHHDDDDDDDDDDEDINFLARKKPATSEPAKRRRVAVIDDDEDDADF